MNAIKGAIIAIPSSLLIAALFAYIFRLPIPLGGMIGPLGDINPYGENVVGVIKSVIGAWIFYGAFGGIIVIPIFGAIAGYIAGRKNINSDNKNKMIVKWSIIASGIPILFLSILDYIIGPW